VLHYLGLFSQSRNARSRRSDSFIFLTVRSLLAAYDIVDVAHWKALHINAVFPRIVEFFNPIGWKDQVQIERAIL